MYSGAGPSGAAVPASSISEPQRKQSSPAANLIARSRSRSRSAFKLSTSPARWAASACASSSCMRRALIRPSRVTVCDGRGLAEEACQEQLQRLA